MLPKTKTEYLPAKIKLSTIQSVIPQWSRALTRCNQVVRGRLFSGAEARLRSLIIGLVRMTILSTNAKTNGYAW